MTRRPSVPDGQLTISAPIVATLIALNAEISHEVARVAEALEPHKLDGPARSVVIASLLRISALRAEMLDHLGIYRRITPKDS